MKYENFIFIKGGKYNDIENILKHWVDLHSENLESGLIFKLFNIKNGKYVILADKKLDNERFFYLINNLYYPMDIEHQIEVEGYTIGKEEKELLNKHLLAFITPEDDEYINVSITTSENENYKIDLGGNVLKQNINKQYYLPNNFNLGNFIQFETKNENFKKNSKIKVKNYNIRFAIIFSLITTLFSLTFYFLRTNYDFEFITFMISFLFFWLIQFNEKLLTINKYYFGSLFFSLLILTYNYIIYNQLPNKNSNLNILSGAFIPLLYLIMLKPLNIIFKKIMKREPVNENPAPTFADGIYGFILILGSILIPIYLFY